MINSSLDNHSNEKKDQGKNIIIGVLVLLVLISGIKVFSDYQTRIEINQEVLKLSSSNSELNVRIDSITYQLDLRIQTIEKLGGSIDALEDIKNKLLAERSLGKKRTSAEIAALHQEINGLISTIKEKDDEILTLREVNQALNIINQDLKTNQTSIEEKVSELNVQKNKLQEKITIASKLKAEKIIVSAVNARGRERVETTKDFRNRQIERLKVSFTIADNKIAEKGPCNVFVQVLAPNSKPIFDIAKGSGTFMVNGEELFFTAKQDIIFDNSQQILTFYYEKGTEYSKGIHDIRVFIDDYQIGSTSFNVK